MHYTDLEYVIQEVHDLGIQKYYSKHFKCKKASYIDF